MKKLVALVLFCAPCLAFAGSTGVINISSSLLQIINSPQIAYLYVTVTSGGCSNSSAAVLIMDSTNPLGGAMYATLLTAKTSGKTVNITTSGCSSSGYPIMTSIYLET
jgi:hypothetical protein